MCKTKCDKNSSSILSRLVKLRTRFVCEIHNMYIFFFVLITNKNSFMPFFLLHSTIAPCIRNYPNWSMQEQRSQRCPLPKAKMYKSHLLFWSGRAGFWKQYRPWAKDAGTSMQILTQTMFSTLNQFSQHHKAHKITFFTRLFQSLIEDGRCMKEKIIIIK